MILGVDLSHYQDVAFWPGLKTAGVSFAYLKATQGMTLRDPSFAGFAEGCAEQGIPCGAYHFFEPKDDPVIQANFFLSVVGKQAGDLAPVLDWETFSGSPLMDTEAALEWLQQVEVKTGRTPVIYGSPSPLEALDLDSRFSRYPLWIAEYGVASPRIPAPWTTYAYWQYTDKGELPCIKGTCDLNYASGILT